MASEEVISLGTSYLIIASTLPPAIQSPLLRRQCVLLYCKSDTDEIATYAKAGPYADSHGPQPYKVMPGNRWIVQAVDSAENSQAKLQRLDLVLHGCKFHKLRHIVFLKPSLGLCEWFAQAGAAHLAWKLAQDSVQTVHITLLAPDSQYYDKLQRGLAAACYAAPQCISPVQVREQTLLSNLMSMARCVVCKRIAEIPIYRGDKVVCLGCEDPVRRSEYASDELVLLKKVFEDVQFTCRCDARMPLKSSSTHAIDCGRKEWSCTKCGFSDKSEPYFEHILERHFDQLTDKLDKYLG